MMIYITLSNKKLYLANSRGFTEGLTEYRYSVGVGREETPTPTGCYRIYEKVANPSEAYTAFDGDTPCIYGSRCMELNLRAYDFDNKVWRPYCIHGTNEPDSIGKEFSQGCIRMLNEDIEELYCLVSEGDEVVIMS